MLYEGHGPHYELERHEIDGEECLELQVEQLGRATISLWSLLDRLVIIARGVETTAEAWGKGAGNSLTNREAAMDRVIASLGHSAKMAREAVEAIKQAERDKP